MVDVVSPEKRSQMMSGIKGRNTRPEIVVRKALHARGFRFRLHSKKLSGRPDIVLPRHRVAVFVNGCFWHRHQCHLFKWPKTREQFWRDKLNGNAERDRRNWKSLERSGWRVYVFWECFLRSVELRSPEIILAEFESWIGETKDRVS